MKKGQSKHGWTPEQKAEIVHKHMNDHISVRTLEKEYHADRSMICKWVKKYIADEESSFAHKGHPGNPFTALHGFYKKRFYNKCWGQAMSLTPLS